MNLKLIEEKFYFRFKFYNTTFCEKTFYPTYRFIDTIDKTEYILDCGPDVDLQTVLQNLIIEKRNSKIDEIIL